MEKTERDGGDGSLRRQNQKSGISCRGFASTSSSTVKRNCVAAGDQKENAAARGNEAGAGGIRPHRQVKREKTQITEVQEETRKEEKR